MNYQKHYNKLIERARNRLLEGYVENHHIIPRCMNGTNDATNIVALTPEEHYVAHQLLVKIYPNELKLVYAAKMMTIGSLKNCGRNNKLYGWLRTKFSNIQKGHVVLEKTKIKMGLSRKGKTHEEIYGVEESKQLKENLSRKLKGRSSGRLGKKNSKEHNRKISKFRKGRLWTAARRAAQKKSNYEDQ